MIADCAVVLVGGLIVMVVLHDVDDAALSHGDDPDEHTAHHRIQRLSLQFVLDGMGNSQVALNTYGGELQGAVVDGAIEDETRQRAQEVGQVPLHVVDGLLHPEGKEDQEEQVRDGEAYQQDIHGCGTSPYLLDEGIEGNDVGWQPKDERDEVHSKNEVFVFLFQHFPGCQLEYSIY